MVDNKFFEDLSSSQKDLNSRIFDLVIGRVIKRVYLSLDGDGKENMNKIFLGDDDKEKEKFIKKHIPNFKKLFKEEADKIEEEIKVEIKKET